ncbi:MAG: hypothetical protein HY910_03035 [Desulfarculus sp.]|nr:hypothetical protein [Desulfarculus sp.]
MEGKSLRKAAVSVIIYPPGAGQPAESWPPVILCGPQEDDEPQEADGRQILELVYDSLRVVGILVERGDLKIIRVEVHEHRDTPPRRTDTQGQPTLK